MTSSYEDTNIIISNVKANKNYSFLDYYQAGVEMNLIGGIDYAAGQTNHDVETVLNAILPILLNFDSDQKVPMFGAGATFDHMKEPSHGFALNSNIFRPEGDGLEEVLQCHLANLTGLKYTGESYFGYFLEHVYESVKYQTGLGNCSYFTVFMISDGVIKDLDVAIEYIVKLSKLPVSIIIVGIGRENFSLMKTLDSDKKLLYDKKNNQAAIRDGVQFVEFEKGKNQTVDSKKLMRELLNELPKQVVEYYRYLKLSPEDIKYDLSKQHKRDFYSNLYMEWQIRLTNQGKSHEELIKLLMKGVPHLGV